MNIITKRAIAVALSIAAVSAAVTPSLAQSRTQRALGPQQIQDPYLAQQRYGQFPVPGYVLANPYECWSDEGYGRYSNCANAGS